MSTMRNIKSQAQMDNKLILHINPYKMGGANEWRSAGEQAGEINLDEK